MALKRRRNAAPRPICPLAECMQLLAGAWTPNIIWYLSQGPRRFSELRADIAGLSAKVLSTRLKELEIRGVVTRTVAPTAPPSVEYQLTPLGGELMPAITAIVDVSHRLRAKLREDAASASGAVEVRALDLLRRTDSARDKRSSIQPSDNV